MKFNKIISGKIHGLNIKYVQYNQIKGSLEKAKNQFQAGIYNLNR